MAQEARKIDDLTLWMDGLSRRVPPEALSGEPLEDADQLGEVARALREGLEALRLIESEVHEALAWSLERTLEGRRFRGV